MAAYAVQEYESPKLGGRRSYAVFHPKNGPRDPNPILFLHGAGEVGDRIEVAADSHGPLNGAENRPFTVIVPQLPRRFYDDDTGWRSFDRDIDRILSDVATKYSVNTDHPYLTGLSMGAEGVWEFGAAKIREWSAVASFAGGVPEDMDPVTIAAGIKDTPVWAFVNRRELFPELRRATAVAVSAVEAAGGRVRHTYYNNAFPNHNCWWRAYAGQKCPSKCVRTELPETTLYAWFSSKGK